MPYKPKRPCSQSGCPRLTDGRYCEAHAKEAAKQYELHQRDPGTNKRYGSSWRKARKAFLDEHPLCELCRHQGRTTPATVAHHIKAARDGGSDEAGNLMALCASCHSSLHGRRKKRLVAPANYS
jgi:5-methylcytosine-specific restriction protein A